MIQKDLYLEIEKKYGYCASWAIWVDEGKNPKSNIDDLTIFNLEINPDILEQLNPEIIMVGLNFSRKMERSFGNFHDNYPYAQDYKIRYTFKNTEYYGAYMTDIIKSFEQKISESVVSYFEGHFSKVNKFGSQCSKKRMNTKWTKPTQLPANFFTLVPKKAFQTAIKTAQ